MSDEPQDTPFWKLLQSGDVAGFKQRILADPESIEDDDGGTPPLGYAISAGNAELVAFLIEHGADVNREIDGLSLLYKVRPAEENSLPIVRQLLDAGFNIGERGAELGTALHWAASMNAWDIASLLIERGADVNACDLDGITPLHEAVSSGHRRMVRLLLQSGADRTIDHPFWGSVLKFAHSCGHDHVLSVFDEIP